MDNHNSMQVFVLDVLQRTRKDQLAAALDLIPAPFQHSKHIFSYLFLTKKPLPRQESGYILVLVHKTLLGDTSLARRKERKDRFADPEKRTFH